MKKTSLLIILVIVSNVLLGLNPRIGYGKYENEYYPIKKFTRSGAIVEIVNGKTKTIRWKDTRLVPGGSEFSTVKLKMAASEPTFDFVAGETNLDQAKVRIKFRFESDKFAKDLILLLVRRNSIEGYKLPKLKANKVKNYSVRTKSSFPIRFMIFDGDKEVLTSLRRPLRETENDYNLDTSQDRDPYPTVTVAPRYIYEDAAAKVRVHINVLGLVTRAELLETTSKDFGKLAVEAAEKWIFCPKVKNGDLVPTELEIPFKNAVQ